MSYCANPTLCYTNQQTGQRKFIEWRLASPLKKTLYNVPFNCGLCVFCRKKKSIELAVRCVLHASMHLHNCFITLTYDESQPDYHNNLQYRDIQLFKKNLSSYCVYNYDKKIKIFNVHEYGKNGKKHWHLVIFNHDFLDKTYNFTKNGIPHYKSDVLAQKWPHGLHDIGNVTEASAMYQSQYMEKDRKNGNLNNSKKSNSQHKGIGLPYFQKHYRQILSLGYIPFGEKKVPIPRYFQKIAHKHWSHFNEPSNFYDTDHRKKLYTPFKHGDENIDIANLYTYFKNNKDLKILELEDEWNKTVLTHLSTNAKPDFIIAAENYIYDQNNKNKLDNF